MSGSSMDGLEHKFMSSSNDESNLNFSPRIKNVAYMTGYDQFHYGDMQPLSVHSNKIASISNGFEKQKKKNLVALSSHIQARETLSALS